MTALIAYLALVTATFHTAEVTPKGKVERIQCTAVYVSPNEALTAAHCVQHIVPGTSYIKDEDGHAYPVAVLFSVTHTDIALLAVKCPSHKFVNLGYPVTKGQPIFVYSSADGMVGTFARGFVENIVIEDFTNTPMIVHSATILHGSSGSGLFDRRGRLLGINTLVYEGISYAVDLGPVRRFLEDAAERKALTPK